MIKELHTTKFWLQPSGRLEVYHYKLATKLNKYFKTYDNGLYKFLKGEEAIFFVSQNDYNEDLWKILTPKKK